MAVKILEAGDAGANDPLVQGRCYVCRGLLEARVSDGSPPQREYDMREPAWWVRVKCPTPNCNERVVCYPVKK